MDFDPYISKPFDPVNQFVDQRIVRFIWISEITKRTLDIKKLMVGVMVWKMQIRL